MKKAKINNVPKKNAKISDFFSKISTAPIKNESNDNKRKSAESPNSTVLNSVTNLPEKSSRSLSPEYKKVKQGESHAVFSNSENSDYSVDKTIQNGSIRLVKTEFLMDHNAATASTNNFHMVSPKKIIKPLSERTPTPKKKSTLGSPKSKTPQSGRKTTPKRLFEKSPRKLEEFNVQILKDFVKISPSTSNKILKVRSTPEKLTNYEVEEHHSPIRPDNSTASAQIHNESTPSKLQMRLTNSSSHVNTKLNFSESSNSPNHLRMAEDRECYLEDDLEGVFNSSFNETLEQLDTVTFDEPQFCKILAVTRSDNSITLKLQSSKTNQTGTCILEEFWCSNDYFAIGDKICVSARRNSKNQWVVNNTNGWLVYEPDLLISCTSVVGGLFCMRKKVLSEWFRGFDSSNRVMIVGVLAHTLLQHVLKEKLRNSSEIEAALKNILKSKNTVKQLYENSLTYDDIQFELLPFIPKIIEFVEGYINGTSSSYHHDPHNWNGKIFSIDDIEENLWCPQLGIKGKIDVTTRTNIGIMPLEVKTGKASVSLEHRGQLVLYLLMMNKFGVEASSGLLLYLREGALREIQPTPQEKRDILILRNQLAYYLTRKHPRSSQGNMNAPVLPEPLHNNRACSNCAFNVICTSYLKFEKYDISKNKKLEELQSKVTSHLSQAHLNYFIHWNNLINLEAECNRGVKPLQEIYTTDPAQRELRGRCITNVKVVSIGVSRNGLVEHTFAKDSAIQVNLINSGIIENNYVVISTDNRPAVATGFVTQISLSSVAIAVDRDLTIKHKGRLFHLDTYDSNITHTFNLTSLAVLLEDTARAAELRSIIIDKAPPTFAKKLPSVVARKGASILKRLNHVQQKAVLKALCANQFLLIKGMPGTGKSATIVALIQLLVELDKTVLITSHTHSAIDNICIRLQKFGVDFIRLGSESKMAPELKSHAEAHLTKDCDSPEQLEEVYNRFKVVAVTCLGSGHPLLSKRTLDVCIVDESTQVLQTSTIKPLYSAKSFVLIGDPDQLAPVVKNRDARAAGMSESLFERLSGSGETIALNLNYRMNQTITDLANALTYNGQLKPANDLVANRCLHIPDIELVKNSYRNKTWLLDALTTSLETAVQFIDTGPVWQLPKNANWALKTSDLQESTDGYINIYEAAIVVHLVNALLKGGVPNSDIGVIATYRAQVAQICALLSKSAIDVSTVDQFQGRDKNVVIYSCAKSTDVSKTFNSQKFELLEDHRRLTVAVTRAKRKLIIVGDSSTLQNYSTFSKIIGKLKRNVINFDWQCSILNEL